MYGVLCLTLQRGDTSATSKISFKITPNITSKTRLPQDQPQDDSKLCFGLFASLIDCISSFINVLDVVWRWTLLTSLLY